MISSAYEPDSTSQSAGIGERIEAHLVARRQVLIRYIQWRDLVIVLEANCVIIGVVVNEDRWVLTGLALSSQFFRVTPRLRCP